MTRRAATTLHATCLVVGETGILIRGPSGAGKSTLAMRLLAPMPRLDRFAALVADDRVAILPCHGRLLARPVAPLDGVLEIRGLGLVRIDHEPACVVGLVVDLGEEPPRLPEPDDLLVDIAGIRLPRFRVATPGQAETLLRWRLRGSDDTMMTQL